MSGALREWTSVTKVYRNHTFKTGIQIDDLEGNISQPPQGRGDFSFNGQYTDVPNKNSNLNGIGDLLLYSDTVDRGRRRLCGWNERLFRIEYRRYRRPSLVLGRLWPG